MNELDTARLRNLAHRIAFTRAIHECPEEVAKDLEQAGWLRYLTLKRREHLWKDIEYAMLEEVSRWLWNCKRGRGKNRLLLQKVPMSELRESICTVSPERLLIAKESFRDESRKEWRREYYRTWMRWFKSGKTGPDPRRKRHLKLMTPEQRKEHRRFFSTKEYRQKIAANRPDRLARKYGQEVMKRALTN